MMFCLAYPLSSFAQVTCNWAGQTKPQGLTNFFVINADGVFDPMTSNYQLPSGTDFDINILGRTPVDIVNRQNSAFNYFLSKYGIDFFLGTSNPDGTVTSADGKVLLFHNAIDSRWKQRIIYSGGDMVPQAGWVVHEARYAATVISPTHSLTGSWGGAGELVPYGTTMVDGEWVFEKVVPCTNDSDGSPAADANSIIHLRYQTDVPFIPDFLNRAAFEYDVSPISGTSASSGKAVGRAELNHLTGDLIEAVVKATVRMW